MRVNSLSIFNNANVVNLSGLKKTSYLTKPYASDSISFSASAKNKITKTLDVEPEAAKKICQSLSNSTSGHRAIYGSETFNKGAVKLITLGVAQYAKQHSKEVPPVVIIGGDTRQATRESLPDIAETLSKQGIDVFYIEDPIPTPLLAFYAQQTGTDISILMTASHNPWEYGGFNFITPEGAIAPSEVTHEIANYMKQIADVGMYTEEMEPTGDIFYVNPYDFYKGTLHDCGLIDFEKIADSEITVYYDGLQGTGSYVMPNLLCDFGIDYQEIHSSGQIGPNPSYENLEELRKKVSQAPEELRIGIANDGDADRFGIIDENGNFIDPNDVLLLVAYHLVHNRHLKGDIVRSQATSQKLDIFAKQNNLKTHVTPVGFKYLASDILKAREEGRDIIVAGEESGGLTTYGHIPEKDGIIADFLILDLMATEKRPISQILKDVKESLGVSIYRDDYSKRLKDDFAKEKILQKVQARYESALNGEVEFGQMHTIDIEKTKEAQRNMRTYRESGDGYKFVMTDNSTVLVRKSGTEPLLRFYIETIDKNEQAAKDKAQALKSYIEENFNE